jgi:hypothetical protein
MTAKKSRSLRKAAIIRHSARLKVAWEQMKGKSRAVTLVAVTQLFAIKFWKQRLIEIAMSYRI